VEAAAAPETVKTAGGHAPQGACQALGTPMTVLLCFLQALLTIRERATQTLGHALAQVQKRVWEAYHAPSPRAFAQRRRRVRAWAATALPDGVMQRRTLDVCEQREPCRKRSDPPEAQRTSNRVERLRQFLDRAFFYAQDFHGRPDAAESRVRA
jgi:hypothetical protein